MKSLNDFMQCAVFLGVENIAIETRKIPKCPPQGLLLRVRACGICGSDVRNYFNGLKDGVTERIMGHEIAGEIIEAAADAVGFIAGDRVAMAPDISCGMCFYCRRGLVNLCNHHRMLGTHFNGGFAQYMVVPREVLLHGFIEKIPDDMAYEKAAFAETAAAVLACQKRLGISIGDKVLIIGDGPVACLHVEVARARGCGSVMLAGLDKLALAAAFKPDYLFDNRDPKAASDGIMNATNGIGADFVICAVPSVEVQAQALSVCRKRGTIVIYGGAPKSNENTVLNSNLIHYNEITVTGAFSYPATGLSDALEAIRIGHINPEAYITYKTNLENIVKGINDMKNGKALKVMVLP